MKIAVTGVTGFLGRHFTRSALAAGHNVRGLVRKRAEDPEEIEAVSGDLESMEALGTLLRGADVAIHFAAVGVQSRDRDWRTTTRTNVAASLDFIEAAHRAGVSVVIMAGTCLEYAGFGRLPGPRWPDAAASPLCDERSTLEPTGSYGATKAAGGVLARARARELGLPLWYLRLASLYGPGDDPAKLVPSAVRAARERRSFAMTAGEQIREWLHVADAVDALLELVSTQPPSGAEAIVNIGTGEGRSLREVVYTIFASVGAPTDLVQLGARPYRTGEVHSLVMSTTRRERLLAWKPTQRLEVAVASLGRGL